MGQAANVWTAVSEVEAVAARLRVAVPEHWTGRAAHHYLRTATNLATGLDSYRVRLGALASALHTHELEVASVRAALATGGMAAV